MVEVTDAALQQAAGEGMDAFIQVFTDAYKRVIGGELTADTMPLAYRRTAFVAGVSDIPRRTHGRWFLPVGTKRIWRLYFANPFAKVMRLWGVDDLSKLVYAAKKIYDVHREDLERERTDDEFMAMYEQYEAFDELEDEFLEKEEEYTALVASYVDEHLESFAKIIKQQLQYF